MKISQNLALEIYTIELFHLLALLLILGFTYYIFLKTKKTALFYSYAAVVAMLSLWMVSKILKTVAPNESLRWFFIVSQYFGIQFLGLTVIFFAVYLKKDRLIHRKQLLLLSIFPALGFFVVLTNPFHYGFYSYYDFYQDAFGILFYPITAIVYLYLFTGIIMLSQKFTHQQQFINRIFAARCFAVVILFAVFGNIYYLLVKLTEMPFVFSFPFFDFTPITSAIALMLFILPAYKYRFLDLTPIAYRHVFDQMPDGIVFLKNGSYLHTPNASFKSMFGKSFHGSTVEAFLQGLNFVHPEDAENLASFLNSKPKESDFFLLQLNSFMCYKVYIGNTKKKQTILRFKEFSNQIRLKQQIEQDRQALAQKKKHLEQLGETSKELAITQAHNKVSQDLHDILGHSLTVVMNIADLASTTKVPEKANEKLDQIHKLLSSSISDLKHSLTGKSTLRHTTLIKAIQSLSNDAIALDLSIQGNLRELNSRQTEAIFRICQEAITNAIKHGTAQNILINLRFKIDELECYIIDDGVGCDSIQKGFGIKGIIRRIAEIDGRIVLGSDGEKGFHIHFSLPLCR